MASCRRLAVKWSATAHLVRPLRSNVEMLRYCLETVSNHFTFVLAVDCDQPGQDRCVRIRLRRKVGELISGRQAYTGDCSEKGVNVFSTSITNRRP